MDKYRPTEFKSLTCHADLTEQLEQLVTRDDFPHLLVYGPPGSGKKTRIHCMLRAMFGSGVDKMKVEHRNWKINSKTVDLVTIGTMHHIELNPSEVGTADRGVIQEVLKEIAQSVPLDQRLFKVVIIKEVDQLSRGAQHALRKTMEKYMSTCRLILYCNNTSKVIDPIRSRCLMLRVPAPPLAEVSSVLLAIAKKQNFDLHPTLAVKIAESSHRNLRRAILQLEATAVRTSSLTADQALVVPDWEAFIDQIAALVLKEQTAKQLLLIRGKLYELLSHCIPPTLILRGLMLALLDRVDATMKNAVVDVAAFFEHRIQIGSKAIIHLEAFCAKFMAIYKGFLIQSYGV